MRILIGPLGGNQGLGFSRTSQDDGPGVAFVNGASSGAAPPSGPELLRASTRNGAAWTAGLGCVRISQARLAARPCLVADLQDDVFNWTQAAGFVAEFCSLGGTIAKRIWVPPGHRTTRASSAGYPRRARTGFFAGPVPRR